MREGESAELSKHGQLRRKGGKKRSETEEGTGTELRVEGEQGARGRCREKEGGGEIQHAKWAGTDRNRKVSASLARYRKLGMSLWCSPAGRGESSQTAGQGLRSRDFVPCHRLLWEPEDD